MQAYADLNECRPKSVSLDQNLGDILSGVDKFVRDSLIYEKDVFFASGMGLRK